MVFTKLSAQEKEAFFGLLDEYFESRPELLSGGGGQSDGGGIAGTGVSTAAAASVVQRALAAGGTTSSTGTGKSNNPYSASMNQAGHVDVAQAVSLGRVAATSLAFSGSGGGQSHPHPQSQSQNPPSLPRRGVANGSLNVVSERTSTTSIPGVEIDKLVTKKTSVFSAFKKPESAGVVIPPAFAAPKNTFGPPPVRRATSDTNANANANVGASVNAGGRVAQRRVVPAPPPASGQEQEQEAAEGEWAEVLYDYSSEDPGDLAVEAGTRVFVTDKTSEDWWTGQIEGRGRQGLFPASYVKLL